MAVEFMAVELSQLHWKTASGLGLQIVGEGAWGVFEIRKWPEATLLYSEENNTGCEKLEDNGVLLELPELKHEYSVSCTPLESLGDFAIGIS